MAIPYDIETEPKAEDELIELWQSASRQRRDEITRASHAIDRELSQDAHRKGFAYKPGLPLQRVYVRKPLVVYFEVVKPQGQGRGRLRITSFKSAEAN